MKKLIDLGHNKRIELTNTLVVNQDLDIGGIIVNKTIEIKGYRESEKYITIRDPCEIQGDTKNLNDMMGNVTTSLANGISIIKNAQDIKGPSYINEINKTYPTKENKGLY